MKKYFSQFKKSLIKNSDLIMLSFCFGVFLVMSFAFMHFVAKIDLYFLLYGGLFLIVSNSILYRISES